jgi:hypothetical protein
MASGKDLLKPFWISIYCGIVASGIVVFLLQEDDWWTVNWHRTSCQQETGPFTTAKMLRKKGMMGTYDSMSSPKETPKRIDVEWMGNNKRSFYKTRTECEYDMRNAFVDQIRE